MVPLQGTQRSIAFCTGLLIIFQVSSAVWVHKLCSKISPGIFRLLAVLPLVAGNFLAPFLFDNQVVNHAEKERALAGLFFTVFLVTWVSNCKVLAYALNRGYLAKVENWSSWKFLGAFILPIQPRVVKPEDKILEGEQKLNMQDKIWIKLVEVARLVLSIAIKIGFLLLFSLLVVRDYHIGSVMTAYFYNGILMVWLGQTFDLAQVLALIVFNIDCIDSFNHPYLSVDFTEMWSKRWNTMTAGVMKSLSYDIIRDGFFVRPCDEVYAKTEKPKRSLAKITIPVISTFVFSGLLHFMVFWYITRTFAWTWFLFFAAFGPVVIVEGVVKNLFQTKLGIKSLPRYLSMPLGSCYTVGVSTLLASILFTPPALAAGVESLADFYQKLLLGPYAF